MIFGYHTRLAWSEDMQMVGVLLLLHQRGLKGAFEQSRCSRLFVWSGGRVDRDVNRAGTDDLRKSVVVVCYSGSPSAYLECQTTNRMEIKYKFYYSSLFPDLRI